MASSDRREERRARYQGWLQTVAFLGAAAILAMVLYPAIVVQSERRAQERTATVLAGTQTAPTARPRSPTTGRASRETPRWELLQSTPLPASMPPILPDNAAQVAEVARWGRGALTAVAWSPAGGVLAVGTTVGVYLYDPVTLQELRFLDTGGSVSRLAFSPDGEILVAMSRWSAVQWPQVQQWRVADGVLVETIRDVPATDVAMAFSPEGTLLLAWVRWDGNAVALWQGGMASAGTGSIVLVDGGGETRLPIPRSEAGEGGPFAVALSPGGRFVVVGMPDGNVYVRQLSDGILIATFTAGFGPTDQLAFSPNGRLLAVTSTTSGVRVWQVAGGALAYVLEEGTEVTGLAFSPDGQRLALWGGGTARLYGTDSGALVRTLDMQGYDTSTGATAPAGTQAAFSPGGQTLAVGVYGGPLLFFQTEGGTLRQAPPFGQVFTGLSLSADGGTLATCGFPGGDVWLWDVAQAVPLRALHTPAYPADSGARPPGAFSPDGQILALAERDDVALWRVADGVVVGRLPPEGFPPLQGSAFADGQPRCTAFSPNGRWLAVGYREGGVLLWQMPAGTLRWMTSEVSVPENMGAWCDLSFSPSGQYLAASWFGSPLYLWSVPDGTAIHQWRAPEEWGPGGPAFSPDGLLLAAGTSLQQVSLWEVHSGELRRTLEAPAGIGMGLAFSPNSSLVAGGSEGGAVFVWRVDDGTLLCTLEGHKGMVTGLVFSPDGSALYSASVDGTVRVWGGPGLQR